MSIVIKSNQLNTIIYKYLLEAGLSHTAYTFFNQAKLQSSLQEFKYDIKTSHLLMLLEKGLILSQIEAHVNFGDYQECLEPFYLLKSHTCKITEKIKTDQNNFMKELNNNITECIKRTNAIYNTQLTNKNYQEIIYEPRGSNYFDKFQKFKITDNQLIDTQQADTHKENKLIKIDGQKESFIAIWNRTDNVIYLAQNDGYEDTIVSKVYPCTLNTQIETPQLFKLTPNALIIIFPHNQVKLINRQNDSVLQFSIPLKHNISSIQNNPNLSNLITFQTVSQYLVLNTKNMEEIFKGQGMFKWRGFDQYIVFDEGKTLLKSLINQQPLISYTPLQNEHKANFEVYEVQISPNRTFFFISAYRKNKLWVYTFEKQQPLYVFDFQEEQQQVRKVIWAHRNEVDYLCILTDIAMRVWEVQLNSYCLKIDLQKYELGEVHSIASLEKNESETFLLALGSQNLLVSDIANQKIERIQSPTNTTQMQNIGKSSVIVSTDQNIYFLDGQKLTELFK